MDEAKIKRWTLELYDANAHILWERVGYDDKEAAGKRADEHAEAGKSSRLIDNRTGEVVAWNHPEPKAKWVCWNPARHPNEEA